MNFIKVAKVSDLPVDKMIRVKAGGKNILLANLDGTFYAICDRCTHLGGSLAEGVMEDGAVRCPRHGARFDLKTGKALGEAKIAFIKMPVKDEETYPVQIDGDAILVGIS